MRRLWFTGLLSVLSLLAQSGPQSGASIFLTQCAVCHGAGGEGGRGPTLARPKLRHAPDEEALFRVIRRGIPNSGMPATGLAEREIRQVMEHVRALARVAAPARPPGDPLRGRQIYAGKGGCVGCHQAFGPDLSGIGEQRSFAHLRTSLTDPAADVPAGFMLVEAVTQGSRKISGARLNEDTFSLQLLDASGNVRSFWKSELRAWKLLPGQTPMPSYRGVLSETELDDLVAFLVTP